MKTTETDMTDTTDMTHNTHNYFAHGGSELVIGGKLTFGPDATIEDNAGVLEGAASSAGTVYYIADSEATTIAALKDDFNSLLAALRSCGLMDAGNPS